MKPAVRPCADFEQFMRAVGVIEQYFGSEPSEERIERFSQNLPIERMHAAWDGDLIVGGAGAFPFELTVPGALVPTAGITVVGTAPNPSPPWRPAGDDACPARRHPRAWRASSGSSGPPRTRSTAAIGYGMASYAGSISIPREFSAFARSARTRSWDVRFVDPDEALGSFLVSGTRSEPSIPGMLGRSRDWWQYRILSEGAGPPKRFVVLERDGRPEGYAIYRHKSELDRRYVRVGGRRRRGDRARRTPDWPRLWRYLLDIDWAVRVTTRLLPIDHQLFQILAKPRHMRFRVGDGLWARLVDVGVALSARSYAADGAVVIDVVDEFCPWNEGRWRLADGTAKRSTASPQLRCDVTALGSVYLGAFGFSELVRGGRVEELRRGAAARADAMFRWGRAPWCPEIF